MIAIREDGRETKEFASCPAEWAAPSRSLLRRVLVGADVLAVAGTWLAVLGPLGGFSGSAGGLMPVLAIVTLTSLFLLSSQGLYLARVCRLRTVEISRLTRVAALMGLLVHVFGPRLGARPSAALSFAAATLMATSTTILRGVYSAWLRRRRAAGRHNRPVVIIGPQAETEGIRDLIRRHPELGFDAATTIGPTADVMSALQDHCSDTVVVATGAFSGVELNRLTRRLLDAGVHVHLSTGLSGIDQRRLRAQPMAREPMFYLEPLRISPWQAATKRGVDIVGSAIGILVALPVLLLAAIAIKLEDRGPIFFRHKRVGRNGEEFMIFKLRTMVPGADRKLHLVVDGNQRTGPLFKSHNDPRITRVGRILRATSIDELPQLINVLLGMMSLVGPRPALAHEVAQFDEELRNRERVRPGITGLWQIEGRDDPSFDAYRRLDLYYVENWSLELDFVILLMTARAVVKQALQDRRKQWKSTVAPIAERQRAGRAGSRSRRRQRVLIIVQNLPVPLDRRVWMECQALVERGYGVSVICPKGPGDPSFEELEGVRLHKYRPPFAAKGWFGYIFEFVYCWIRSFLLAVRIRVVDGFGVIQACNPPDTYWALALPFKLFGTRFVYDQHDLNPEVYASRFGKKGGRLYRGLLLLERATYRTADQVISTNESYRRVALRRGDKRPEDVTVVVSGPDAATMRRGPAHAETRKGRQYLCCWLGIMGPQDGVDLALRAARHLVDDFGRTDFHLALLGFGDCFADLRAYAHELDLDEFVTFTGRAGPDMISKYLSTADVGLTPDPLNPLNDVSTMNKTMEYMAYSVPVVATDLRETRATAGDAAIYVDSGQAKEFARVISDLLDDAPLRETMGQVGRRRVEDFLGWEHQAPRYVSVYERLIGPATLHANNNGDAPAAYPLPQCPAAFRVPGAS